MATIENSFVLGSVFYLILAALVFPYSTYCLYRFISISKKHANDGYFRRRHPIANIVFLLCFFVATFIIDPLLVILAMIDYEKPPILNAIGIIDDLTSVMLFAIFMCRVWFLYSEYALHYNMSSWIWKREINPLESNCIIKYRQIFGNAKCCTLLIFVAVFVPIIIILDVIPLFLVHSSTEILLQLAIVLLFIAFTLFILLSQLKRVLDVYHIRRELLFEIAAFGSLLLFTDIVSNVLLVTNTINQTQQILFSSVLSTVTGIWVIYIGTNWVLTKFSQYKLFQSLGDYDVETNDQRINSHDLIQILNTEQGFECFLFHMVHELQLEKMLFIIEILHFKQEIKARLQAIAVEHNFDFDPSSMEWLKLNYIMNDNRDSSLFTSDKRNTNDIDVLFQIDLKALDIPYDPRLKQWSMYQFAVHLYDKYIEEGASLQLSISSDCERFIYSYFRARTMSPDESFMHSPDPHDEAGTERKDGAVLTRDEDEGSSEDTKEEEEEDEEEEAVLVYSEDKEKAQAVQKYHKKEKEYNALGRTQIPHDVEQDAMERMVGIEGVYGDENIKIIYDLFRIYDSALSQVWSVISNEIFNRFKKTSEYGAIYESSQGACINMKHMNMDSANMLHVNKKRAVPSNSVTMD